MTSKALCVRGLVLNPTHHWEVAEPLGEVGFFLFVFKDTFVYLCVRDGSMHAYRHTQKLQGHQVSSVTFTYPFDVGSLTELEFSWLN